MNGNQPSRLVSAELRNLATSDVRRLNRDLMVDVRRWFAACKEDLPELPNDIMLAIVLGPAHRFAQTWVSKRARTSIEDAQRMLADAAWAAVSGLNR